MFKTYNNEEFSTLQGAVTRAIKLLQNADSEINTHSKVKRGTVTATGVALPPTFMTNQEILDATDDSDQVFVITGSYHGETSKASTVAELDEQISRAKAAWIDSVSARSVTYPNGDRYTFNIENDSDAFIEVKNDFIDHIKEELKETNDDFIEVMGRVVAGDITTSDSEFVRIKSFRDSFKSLPSHPNWPDLTTADIPTIRSYLSGLSVSFYDSYHNDDYTSLISPASSSTETYPTPETNANKTRVWTGFYKPDETGNHTFSIRSDDGSAMWIDGLYGEAYDSETAVSAHFGIHSIADVAKAHDKTVSLIAEQYYPIIIMQGNNSGGGDLEITITTPTTSYQDAALAPYYFRERED